MAQRLFDINKIPVSLMDYQPGTERRRGETVKILTLSLKVQPFDSKMATAVDDGLKNDAGVKDALFKASNGEPKKHRTRVNFDLGCTQQNLIMFASTDTAESRMAFTQCRIGGVYVRTSKNVNAYAFCFRASFGPVGRDEMEFVHAWLGGQLAVTFEESQEQLEYDEPADADEENGNEDAAPAKGPKAPSEPPMFGDDDPAAKASEAGKKVVADKNRENGHRYPGKDRRKKTAAKRGKGRR